MKPKSAYRSCRLCSGSRVNPDGMGICPRCDGTARDPEDIDHGDVVKLAEEAAAEFRPRYRKLIPFVGGPEPQRGAQTTPSNDIDPSADLKRGVRLIFITGAICYLFGVLTGVLL